MPVINKQEIQLVYLETDLRSFLIEAVIFLTKLCFLTGAASDSASAAAGASAAVSVAAAPSAAASVATAASVVAASSVVALAVVVASVANSEAATPDSEARGSEEVLRATTSGSAWGISLAIGD